MTRSRLAVLRGWSLESVKLQEWRMFILLYLPLHLWEISTAVSPEVLAYLIGLLYMFRLSQSVLQGFTCAAANEMEAERFQELAKVMKKKKVKLGEDQVSSCILKCHV